MIETRIIKGVVPVVQTPIDAKGEVDVGGLTKLIEYLIGKDVAGFWCLGTGSEDMNLSFEKRLTVARTACAVNAGRKPLVLGCGFFALEDMLNFVDATRDLEFDSYHVMPYHPLLSLDRMEWMYRHIADYAPKPLWMYTSANWCRAFTPDFVAKLKDHKNIAGIKFSSSNTVDQLKVLGMAEERFQVITAVANQWYAALAMGSRAGTTSLAGPLPEPLQEIYRLFVSGDQDGALKQQRNLMKFLGMMPKGSKADNFLTGAEEKYMLSLRGICQPHMTGYYRPLSESEQAQVRKALEDCGYMNYIAG
ncbi:dihydrodipicolinate synthase family protein [Ferrovibrio sp.]|uniref:dihydrodipicolinate synthase family protein n=1 Tax=Ferrovibrio sp. TaxID=1917215 RepID=UPI000CBC4F6C|nr:dihydrodipicolinate synthase family protein [Ferrovibrio sp.]PJI41918.1 MAG: dihydrodipicolinate synthase family protein [Ferrovibrio sp.]